MASIRKHGTGWRAFVARQGVRKSKTFPTKQEARDWAARQEHLILSNEATAASITLGALFQRYADEVSPGKRGHRWEAVRLARFQRDPICEVMLKDLRPSHFADWRDKRLKEVAPASVARELQLMSAALTCAKKEWQVIPSNPLEDVRKPSKPAPRTRLPTAEEFERLAHVAGDDLTTATARAYHAFRFACETAMRAGEIVGLRPGDITGNVAHLPKTKTGVARDVPLSRAALALLAQLPPSDPVFGLTSAQLDALWRKVRGLAGIEGLNFHDSRAFAATQLAKKVDVMTLGKITGHRNLSLLMNTYYRTNPSDIADLLD
jgi:integrase